MPILGTFKDLNVTFKKHPVTNDLVTAKDQAAIVQAITALLLTRKGERPFQPELGCGVYNLLFEPMDFASSALIKSEIKETLQRYEPRIKVGTIYCKPDFKSNGYNVEMAYVIKGKEDSPVAVEFFLERTR